MASTNSARRSSPLSSVQITCNTTKRRMNDVDDDTSQITFDYSLSSSLASDRTSQLFDFPSIPQHSSTIAQTEKDGEQVDADQNPNNRSQAVYGFLKYRYHHQQPQQAQVASPQKRVVVQSILVRIEEDSFCPDDFLNQSTDVSSPGCRLKGLYDDDSSESEDDGEGPPQRHLAHNTALEKALERQRARIRSLYNDEEEDEDGSVRGRRSTETPKSKVSNYYYHDKCQKPVPSVPITKGGKGERLLISY